MGLAAEPAEIKRGSSWRLCVQTITTITENIKIRASRDHTAHVSFCSFPRSAVYADNWSVFVHEAGHATRSRINVVDNITKQNNNRDCNTPQRGDTNIEFIKDTSAS